MMETKYDVTAAPSQQNMTLQDQELFNKALAHRDRLLEFDKSRFVECTYFCQCVTCHPYCDCSRQWFSTRCRGTLVCHRYLCGTCATEFFTIISSQFYDLCYHYSEYILLYSLTNSTAILSYTSLMQVDITDIEICMALKYDKWVLGAFSEKKVCNHRFKVWCDIFLSIHPWKLAKWQSGFQVIEKSLNF